MTSFIPGTTGTLPRRRDLPPGCSLRHAAHGMRSDGGPAAGRGPPRDGSTGGAARARRAAELDDGRTQGARHARRCRGDLRHRRLRRRPDGTSRRDALGRHGLDPGTRRPRRHALAFAVPDRYLAATVAGAANGVRCAQRVPRPVARLAGLRTSRPCRALRRGGPALRPCTCACATPQRRPLGAHRHEDRLVPNLWHGTTLQRA